MQKNREVWHAAFKQTRKYASLNPLASLVSSGFSFNNLQKAHVGLWLLFTSGMHIICPWCLNLFVGTEQYKVVKSL